MGFALPLCKCFLEFLLVEFALLLFLLLLLYLSTPLVANSLLDDLGHHLVDHLPFLPR